jgi:HPr kinase/phosphorylase
LEVVIELEVWDEKEVYTRTGLDKMEVTIDDVKILYVRLPIFPGKNITVIAETIAMNYLLKHYGFDAAQELQNRLQNKIRDKHQESERIVNYFEHDFE